MRDTSNPKVSVIAAVYKDVRALELIVDAMRSQTYKNFELVVAEDGDDPGIRDCVDSIKDIEIIHTTQEDVGIRKSRSQNNGIIASTGSYLIFIDGDCIPYSRFIEGHVSLSEKTTVLSGRRVNLGQNVSESLRSGSLDPLTLERRFVFHLPGLLRDKSTHVEQGIQLSHDGIFYRHILSRRSRTTDILGCNFSCYKKDIIKVNGFDESYEGTALGDDTDIQWRFLANGMRLKGCHNIANIFHLYHSREHRMVDHSEVTRLMEQRKKVNTFYCQDGISTHPDYMP